MIFNALTQGALIKDVRWFRLGISDVYKCIAFTEFWMCPDCEEKEADRYANRRRRHSEIKSESMDEEDDDDDDDEE